MKSSVMPLTLQHIKLLRYSPQQGQSQSATTQTIIQLFREFDGFTITPEEVLIICLLNTIQEKSVLIKVQEQITDTSTWEEVCNIIVKIDSTSRLSDHFKQKNRFSGATVGTKACRACRRKGHLSAACTVPKDKLFCKHCDTKNSHNTAGYVKKQKVDKDKKQGENNGKKENNPKPLTASHEKGNASEEARKQNLSQMKTNGSPPECTTSVCRCA